MVLEDFGYNEELEKIRNELIPDNFEIGRVISEHKERYIVKTNKGEFEAEITGNMRFTAKSRLDFPAVGDWVSLLVYDTDFAIIHKVFPRFSIIKRQAVSQTGEIQIIATNIDIAFIVQAVDRDFNINRLERYLTICNSSKVNPIIVLSKIDLISSQQISELMRIIKLRINNVQIIAISNESGEGYATIKNIIEKGKTYCLLGSSGVGKSTLLNNLTGKSVMRTGSISDSTNKGKHVTSHRELFLLDTGGILIDNPGMREVGKTDSTEGLEITFDKILNLSEYCKYKDCSHTFETGCSVKEAVNKGEISQATYENYLKMLKEKEFFELSVANRRKKEKEFGKLMKNYKKEVKKNHSK